MTSRATAKRDRIATLKDLISRASTPEGERESARRFLARLLAKKTNTTPAAAYATMYDRRSYGTKYDERVDRLSLTEIAKLIRADIKTERKYGKTQATPDGIALVNLIATTAFNDVYPPVRDWTGRSRTRYATFDARVFTVPDPVEVANYYLWRQRDAVRNSISMAAQAVIPHKQLQGKSGGQMQEMLWSEHGINWNDYPDGVKRGRVCVRHTEEQDIVYTDRRTGQEMTTRALRSRWVSQAAPHFTAKPDGWLASVIPPMPTLAALDDTQEPDHG